MASTRQANEEIAVSSGSPPSKQQKLGDEDHADDDQRGDLLRNETQESESSPSVRVGADDALRKLSRVLNDTADKTLFTIGGTIDAAAAHNPLPLTIRWSRGSISDGSMVSLPAVEDGNSFQKLVDDCAPATFGKGMKDVLDEEYRKAGKMDTEDFCTNFTPYEYGVIDTVSQALAGSHYQSHASFRAIRAQLYKLNIYSGPAGKFKTHVDTPRSKDHMGSLVVCLPHPFKRGQLAVRHQAREVVYDWAPKSASTIQWAAFFADCEHEIMEVAEGHRVTLTYNLYWSLSASSSIPETLRAFDETSLVFYSSLDQLMRCPDFLPDGGTIGFTCLHAYPHTARASHDHLKYNLKGIDMVVYQALLRFTHDTQVDSVLDETTFRNREEYDSDESLADQSFLAQGDRRMRFLWDYDPDMAARPEQFYEPEEVTWLNHPPNGENHKEEAGAFVFYGNQAELDVFYSFAAIIARIGTFGQRHLETLGAGSSSQ